MRVIDRVLLVLTLLAVALTTGVTAQGNHTPASNVLYIANNDSATGQNTILAYHRDPVTGSLTAFGSYPTGGTGFANNFGVLGPNDGDRDMIVSPDHTLLFSVNSGSDDISVFRINADGSLTAVNGSPFPSGGSFPTGLVLVGDLLYVTNMNAALVAGNPEIPSGGRANYTALRVSGTGHLSPVPQSTVPVTTAVATDADGLAIPLPPFLALGPAPTSMVESSDGRFLFGTQLFGDRIDVLKAETNGRLTQLASMTPPVTDPPPPYWFGAVLPSLVPGAVMPNLNLPLNAATHPTERILYVNQVVYTEIGVYSWDQDGALTYVRGVLNAGPGFPVPGFAPCWNIVSADGAYMYVMNGGTNSIVAYSLADPLNPAPIQHLPLANNDGAGGIRIVQDPSGMFVYGLSHAMAPGTVSAIHVLKVNADGTLTEQPGSPVLPSLPANALPQGIAVL